MKKRLLISSVLMSAVLACALGTGTYAWYTAASGGYGVGTNSVGTISTTEQEVTLGDLNFEFDVKVGGASSASIKLGTADAATATKAIYKVWNPAESELLPYDIADGEVSGYYSEITITVSAIKEGSTDIKGTAASLTKYAGTYDFVLECDQEGLLASAAPATSKALGDVYNTSTQSIAFTVIIPEEGTTLGGTYATDDSYYVFIEGSDEVKTETANAEATVLSIAKA